MIKYGFFTQVDENGRVSPELLAPPDNGLIARAAQLQNMSVDDIINYSLFNVFEIPYDDQATEYVKFIPGRFVNGSIGPAPADTMVVFKSVNRLESNYSLMQPNSAKDTRLWMDYFREAGFDIENWYIAAIAPFYIPEKISGKKLKAADAKDGLAIFSRVLNLVQPKNILLFGAEATKFFTAAFDRKKATKVKFMDLRGQIVSYPGCKASVCGAPGAVLRSPENLPEFKDDLDIFGNLVRGKPVSKREDPEINIVSELKELEKLCESLIGVKEVAIDLEWGANEELRTMQLCWEPNKAHVIAFAAQDMVHTEIGTDFEYAIQLLNAVLPSCGIIGHNVRGDIKILRKHGLNLLDGFMEHGFDTMLGYHLLPGNETLDKKLELVAIRMLDVPRYDAALRKWIQDNKLQNKDLDIVGYGTIPDDILIPYAAMDAIVTYELSLKIREEMSKYQNIERLYYDINHKVNRPILEMEEKGLYVDMHRLLSLTSLFMSKEQELRDQLQTDINWFDKKVVVETKSGKKKTEVLAGFNPNSSDDIKEVLFGIFKEKDGEIKRKAPQCATILNLTPVKATDNTAWDSVLADGKEHIYNPSTDNESLGILEAEHPFAKKLQNYKFINQVKKTFLRPYARQGRKVVFDGGLGSFVDADGKIHTNFRLTLETGRYATRPNLQNLPKRREKDLAALFKQNGVLDPRYKPIRTIFRATPGKVLVEADWNQAELWTLAYISGDDTFIEALMGSDLHTETTIRMFGDIEHNGRLIRDMSIDEYNRLREEDKVLDSFRVSAKSVTFGVPYGRGAAAIAREVQREGLDCTPETARGWINAWHSTYKNASAYLQWCKQSVIDPGYIDNPWGRRRSFPATSINRILAGMQREAGNFPIQSTVGDAMSKALCNLHEYRAQKPQNWFDIVLSIHDAVMFEVDGNMVPYLVDEVIPECMVNRLEVPGLGLKYGIGKPELLIHWGEHPDDEDLLDTGIPEDWLQEFKTRKY